MILELIKTWVRPATVLIGALMLAACVITTAEEVFAPADFVRAAGLAGIWAYQPEKDSTEESYLLLVREMADGRYELIEFKDGALSPEAEDRIVFGLVPLGGDAYIAVSDEAETEPGKDRQFDYLGLRRKGNETLLYYFGGDGDKPSKKAQDDLIERHGLRRDTKFEYQVRLAGAVSKGQMIALFKDLMATPERFEPYLAVYIRNN